MNPTIEKFGWPATLIREFEHWLVLLRPAQVTLGSLVLAAKSEATAYAQLPREAFAEQADVVRAGARAGEFLRIRADQLPHADDGRPLRPFPRDPTLFGNAAVEWDRISRRRLAGAAVARQNGSAHIRTD